MAEKTDAEALLDAANSASERVAGLHVAFVAVCAYVLVIVFGTTDLDLLMGKGVKLPVVNVDVPIVGFYAFAPYIVVLVHFNLLLQLQLLSRKLFAFDATAPQEEGIGGMHDRLHIFPYTYYLVGRPRPLVLTLVGLMVSITLALLPLATLLALQLQFLAYQSEAVTWWQRVATWLDVAVIVILWPIILHPRDDWGAYWRELIEAHITRRRVWILFLLLLLGITALLFGGGDWHDTDVIDLIMRSRARIGIAILLLVSLALIPANGWSQTPRSRVQYIIVLIVAAVLSMVTGYWTQSRILLLIGPSLFIPLALIWHPKAPRGSLVLLLTLYLGFFLPLALTVDGEGFEQIVMQVQKSPRSLSLFARLFLRDKRALNLNEQILMAKPPKPEVISLIHSGNWQEALKQIEPISLRNRNLRHALMNKVVLVGADMRGTHLQGAVLSKAQLQGANLGCQAADCDTEAAQLQGADLWDAQLQGADLSGAYLQGADLLGSQLQGANLKGVHLQGASLLGTELQGTDLESANLQGADLEDAQLQAADLESALLQGASLKYAQLQGTSLKNAALFAAQIDISTGTKLVDIREDGEGKTWEPIDNDTLRDLLHELQTSTRHSNNFQWPSDRLKHQSVTDRLKKASIPDGPDASTLDLQSCLASAGIPSITCEERFNAEKSVEVHKFIRQLHAYLGQLACESPDIALGIVRQVPRKEKGTGSTREGLQVELKKLLGDPKCIGLQRLSAEEKSKLRAM